MFSRMSFLRGLPEASTTRLSFSRSNIGSFSPPGNTGDGRARAILLQVTGEYAVVACQLRT